MMKPKSNLKVGSFLVAYYHGKAKGVTAIYRIFYVGHSDYTAINIQHQAGIVMGIPTAIGEDEIVGTDAFIRDASNSLCFEVIDANEVIKMTLNFNREFVVDYIMQTPHSVSGVPKGKEKAELLAWVLNDDIILNEATIKESDEGTKRN